MADMRGAMREIYALEQLAAGKSVVHRLHPGAKLLVTFVYIVTVVSFDRNQLTPLAPFFFYPAIMVSLSDTPWGMTMKRVALALPFVALAGISNIIFDRAPAMMLGNVAVSVGVISCLSILLRTLLTVTALVLLIAVTPFADLTVELRRCRVPEMLITLFEMTYRYIGVLLGETSSMSTAYSLRHTNARGIEMRHMGSFVGSLLLRCFDRANRIYSAMKCRGYGLPYQKPAVRPWKSADYGFAIICCALFLVLRFVKLW